MSYILPETGRGTIRRMVEGFGQTRAPAVTNLDDARNNRLDIVKYRLRRNARRGNATRPQEGGSVVVFRARSHAVVCASVDLDCEPGLRTIKVEHVVARRMLPAELEIAGTLSEFSPEERFGQCHLAT
ncbi:hypothetical protein AAW01_10690 [Aurantiacibacter gangjinensis]|uniref:Uncharacterized protein n=1 Tax=Aurantiacibacter gangjinensis TaxID=502682 RepID=A0A0G9MMS0_9SPHN|nr:hypothetical protein AAW01_10690 [Aurantiacibacter gangjinensis]